MVKFKNIKYLILIIIPISILTFLCIIYNQKTKNKEHYEKNMNLTSEKKVVEEIQIEEKEESSNINLEIQTEDNETNATNSNNDFKETTNKADLSVRKLDFIENKLQDSNLNKEGLTTIKKNIEEEKIKNNSQTTKYLVRFDSNGGNVVPSRAVEPNGKAPTPTNNPTKSDAIFENWFIDKDLSSEYNFDTPVTEDITLYAGWKVEIDSVIQNAVNNFKLRSTKAEKKDHNIFVSFSNLKISVISMETALTNLLTEVSNNNAYKSVYISYNGKGFDYLNYSEKAEPLRFIGWLCQNSWSGSKGIESRSGDFVGKTINVEIILKDTYLSENNNKKENYSIIFNSN